MVYHKVLILVHSVLLNLPRYCYADGVHIYIHTYYFCLQKLHKWFLKSS